MSADRPDINARLAGGKTGPAGWIDSALLRDFAAEKTDAHRLCTKRNGWAERFGSDVLVSYKSDAARAEILRELEEWSRAAGQNWSRIFGRFLPKQNAERVAPQLIFGDGIAPLKTTVCERSVNFGVDFSAGYSAGLFLDQRENREFVRQMHPRRLLNCFAYTCSFSVVAALGGGETTSIDLSRKSLDRGRENFALNGLTSEGHRFLADDVLEVLPRLARKGEQFDCVVLDPPTFSRSHTGKAWQVERDFERLFLVALEVCTRSARILLSTNCARLSVRDLERMARFCLKSTRRAGDFIPAKRLIDFPPEAGARSLWVNLR